MVKSKTLYVIWHLFIANNLFFLTHITHMRIVRNRRNAYALIISEYPDYCNHNHCTVFTLNICIVIIDVALITHIIYL